jgi:hypothetical protein
MLLCADEDFPLPVVEELRRSGHDVVTAHDDGRTSLSDADVLTRAHALGRALFVLVPKVPLGTQAPKLRFEFTGRVRAAPGRRRPGCLGSR